MPEIADDLRSSLNLYENALVLSEVVRRVLTVTKLDRIILFGSAATGQMNSDSGIDLLIVEPNPKNRHEESVAIADAIGDVNFAVDVT